MACQMVTNAMGENGEGEPEYGRGVTALAGVSILEESPEQTPEGGKEQAMQVTQGRKIWKLCRWSLPRDAKQKHSMHQEWRGEGGGAEDQTTGKGTWPHRDTPVPSPSWRRRSQSGHEGEEDLQVRLRPRRSQDGPRALSNFKLQMSFWGQTNKRLYLLTGCAILLRGRLLPFIASEGLGSALRPIIPEAAALFGVGIPVLEYNCKPLDKGMLLLPWTVGLT